MKKLIVLFLLLYSSLSASAFDSSSAFNVVTMSYTTNTQIYQRIVLSDAQKAESTINFTVDVKNGGGRPTQNLQGVPQAYASQTDSANIYIKLYDAVGTVIATPTSSNYILHNYGSDPGNHFSTMPGDNLLPWSTASLTYTGSLANVRFIEIYMRGTDGAFWAGNYGPEWRAPTVTIGGDTNNVVYNPEFGIAPNSAKAQGWFNSSNNWAFCGVTSGNLPCVTNESGVTANMWGGGYSANGGSLAGQVGGYPSTLSTSSADTAASTGSPSSAGTGTTSPPAPTYPSYVTIGSGTAGTMTFTETTTIPTSKQDKVTAWTNKTISSGNSIYIDQVGGSGNTVTMEQDGNKNKIDAVLDGSTNAITVKQGTPGIGQNEIKLGVTGSYNALDISQARNDQGLVTGTNGHYHDALVTGSNNTLTARQNNTGGVGGHYMETTINGNQNNVTAKQTDNGNKIMFTTVTGNNNTVDAVQKGTGQHYLENKLTGNGNSVSAVQEGNITNRATLDLTNAGGPASVILNQTGGQSVSVTTSCATAGGCAPITVRQGY